MGTASVPPSDLRAYFGVATGGSGALVTLIPALPRSQGFIITDVAAFDIGYSETFADIEFVQGNAVIARLTVNDRAGTSGHHQYHFNSGIPVKPGSPLVARIVRDGGYEGVSITLSGYLYTTQKKGTGPLPDEVRDRPELSLNTTPGLIVE
ncbi:MAG: hypothetical protein JST22_05010 [Bacteroidetes bacterium]|nr:hypothetical protein [Bacteroidota bacterium]